MVLDEVANWTKRAIERIKRPRGEEVPVRAPLQVLTAGRARAPLVDIFENEKEFLVFLDVPGASAKNTEVSWDEEDMLAVHVRRAAQESGTPRLSEYEGDDWYTQIRLTPAVVGSKASCTVKQGVLRIRLPLSRTLSPRAIPILAT